MERTARRLGSDCSTWLPMFLLVVLVSGYATAGQAEAAGEVEFPGTVISADAKTGKMAVKKESGGTRFTFVTNDQTRWENGLKGIDDLKKDDHIVVWYQVKGSQYIALRVAPKK
jgi:hypothetical protein